jgi:putative FmdB family regulatory protein
MPIYEYQCQNCGHKAEKLQKFSDEPLTHCDECGKDTLKKLISAAGFQLKGTGWYVTDFKDKKPKESKTETKKADKVVKKEAKKTSASKKD